MLFCDIDTADGDWNVCTDCLKMCAQNLKGRYVQSK